MNFFFWVALGFNFVFFCGFGFKVSFGEVLGFGLQIYLSLFPGGCLFFFLGGLGGAIAYWLEGWVQGSGLRAVAHVVTGLGPKVTGKVMRV